MEDNSPDKANPAGPAAGQVMDVKVTPAPTEPVEATEAEAPSIVQAADTTSDTPATSDNSSADPAQDANTSSESEQTSESSSNLPPPAAPSGHKAGSSLVAIIAAIIVALGLVAVTVYAYMKSNEKDPKATETSTTESNPATNEDVDQASGNVEEALKSTEEADFPDAELTDQSLGL